MAYAQDKLRAKRCVALSPYTKTRAFPGRVWCNGQGLFKRGQYTPSNSTSTYCREYPAVRSEKRICRISWRTTARKSNEAFASYREAERCMTYGIRGTAVSDAVRAVPTVICTQWIGGAGQTGQTSTAPTTSTIRSGGSVAENTVWDADTFGVSLSAPI